MNTFLQAIIVSFFVIVVGGGIGYLIYLQFRRKKQKWKAVVYKLSDAVFSFQRDKAGKIIDDIELNKLSPFAVDTLIKDDNKLYLHSLGKTVSEVGADSINDLRSVIPEEKKGLFGIFKSGNKFGRYVEILYQEDTCTILRTGYDKRTGAKVFRPMPYDRSNALTNDYALKKRRYEETKDGWIQALPWITAVIALIAIVVVAVLMTNSFTKMSESQVEVAKLIYGGTGKNLAELQSQDTASAPEAHNLGAQPST